MQSKEVTSVNKKYPFDIICDVLNKTIKDIKDTNDELSSIRNRTIFLESKNESLTIQLSEILFFITNINCTDTFTQSEIIPVNEIGVNCEETELCETGVNCVIDMSDAGVNCESIELRDTGVNCDSIEVRNVGIATMEMTRSADVLVDNTVHIPVTQEVTVVKLTDKPDIASHDDIKDITPVTNESVDISQPIIEPIYSKTDMLYYLERYKKYFLTFAQRNKNNTEDNSSTCRDLIRSFSNNTPPERKRHRDGRILTSHPKKSESKPGVIDTGDNVVDEGIQSSLYDDLDYQNPLGSNKEPRSMTESEMSSVGGAKRLAALSNLSRRSLMVSRMENKRPRRTAESFVTEMDTLAANHERTYPHADTDLVLSEPAARPPPPPLPPTRQDDTVFSQRMKEKLDRKYGPPALPTVKYDLTNADSPLFQVHTTTKPQPSPTNVGPLSHPHSLPPTEPRVKRKHSTKRRSPRKDKDLEEGEIV